MNRRGFLGLIGAGAAGFAIDPERLLWRPGSKSYHFVSNLWPAHRFVYRNPSEGLHRWGLAQSPHVLHVGGEFGFYDGHRIKTEGQITALVELYGRPMIFTERSLFAIYPPSSKVDTSR